MINKKQLIISLMFIALLSLPTVVSAQNTTPVGDGHRIEHERDDAGNFWIQTDIMTIRLDADKPSMKYWYSTDTDSSLSKFGVSYKTIIEFEDYNDDGIYQWNETLTFVPLDVFDWALTTGDVTENGIITEIYASYIKGGLNSEWDDWEDELMPGGEHFREWSNQSTFSTYSDMTMRIFMHIYADDFGDIVEDEHGIQENHTIAGSSEMKIDIEIGNFPFTSNTSMIAILNYIQEDCDCTDEKYHFNVHENDNDTEYDSEDSSDTIEQYDKIDGNIESMMSMVNTASGNAYGFYKWLDYADMTLPSENETAVDVGASFTLDDNGMMLFLAYPNFDGGMLIHDPSIGLYEEYLPTPISIPIEYIAIGVVAVISVVVIVGYKRR